MSDKPDDIIPEFAEVLLGKEALSPHDEDATKEYPTLMQLLMPRFKGKRYSREPGLVTLKIDGSVFRVTVVCPTEGLQTSMDLLSLYDLLSQVEARVSDTRQEWVPTYDAKRRAKRGLDKTIRRQV